MKNYITKVGNKKFSKKKKKAPKVDTSPIWSENNSSLRFSVRNIHLWREILQQHYSTNENVSCVDSTDKDNSGLFQSRIAIFEEDLTVSVTLFITTGTVLVQGNSIQKWLTQEYPILDNLYKNKCCESESPPEGASVPDEIPDEITSLVSELVEKVCSESNPPNSESGLPNVSLIPLHKPVKKEDIQKTCIDSKDPCFLDDEHNHRNEWYGRENF